MTKVKYPEAIFLLYLVPIFVVNIDFGPLGEFFIRSQFLLYPILILFVLSVWRGARLLALMGLFSLIISLYSLMYLYVFDQYMIDLLINSFVFILYVSATYSVSIAIREYGWNEFKRVFDFLVYVAVLLIIFSYFIGQLSGFHFLADDGYGYLRPHALFSEPSAATLFLVYALMDSFNRQRYFVVACCIAAIGMTGSIICILVSMVLFVIRYFESRSPLYLVVLMIPLFVILVFAYNYIIEYFPVNGNGFDSQILRLRQAILSFTTLGEDGYNPRLNTAIEMFEYMSSFKWPVFLGFGPNADDYMPFSNVASSASSLLSYVVFNFGVPVFSLFLILTVNVVLKSSVKTSHGVFMLAVTLTTSLNSAQGLLIYQLSLLVLILTMVQKNEKVFSSRS